MTKLEQGSKGMVYAAGRRSETHFTPWDVPGATRTLHQIRTIQSTIYVQTLQRLGD